MSWVTIEVRLFCPILAPWNRHVRAQHVTQLSFQCQFVRSAARIEAMIYKMISTSAIINQFNIAVPEHLCETFREKHPWHHWLGSICKVTRMAGPYCVFCRWACLTSSQIHLQKSMPNRVWIPCGGSPRRGSAELWHCNYLKEPVEWSGRRPHMWGIVGSNFFPWTDTFMFLEPEHASSR